MKPFQYLLLLTISLLFVQCTNSSFTIAKKQVGKITATTKVSDLKTLFKKDSLVVNLAESDLGTEKNYFVQDNDVYLVFEKGGKPLLKIVPKISDDKNATMQFVQVLSPKYKTANGVNLNSDFKEVHANYKINNIETSFTSIMLYIDELNITIALDKADLGFKNHTNTKVIVDQIPDTAKIKYFTIWFE